MTLTTLPQRLWAKVQVNGEWECWPWTGALDFGGYPMVWGDESHRALRAHRVVYEMFEGPIPPGLTIDHLCYVRLCMNPAHMDLCSAGENAARSPRAPYNVKRRQTHCKRGHLLPARGADGRRRCRQGECK